MVRLGANQGSKTPWPEHITRTNWDPSIPESRSGGARRGRKPLIYLANTPEGSTRHSRSCSWPHGRVKAGASRSTALRHRFQALGNRHDDPAVAPSPQPVALDMPTL